MTTYGLQLLLLAWVVATSSLACAAGEPVRYILDTDIASDCDDAGAVAVVNALADRGEVSVLAMIVCTGGQYGAPALSAINAWYGHQDIPIGTLKDEAFWAGGGTDLPPNAYNFESYNHYLATHYPTALKSGNDAPDATKLYRKVLANAPDASIVINTIGPLINLRRLMQSEPDEHSPLNGTELIREKVKTLVITGGRNPEGTSSNFSKLNAGVHTKPVIDGWPGQIVFVGNEIGGKIMTGWSRNADTTKDHPARIAYQRFHLGNDSTKHHTSDQAGVLYAIRGEGEIYTLETRGHQQCDEKGITHWVAQSAEGRHHAYVCKRPGADTKIAEIVEELMTQGRQPVR